MGTIKRLNKTNVFIVDDSPLYRELISNELKEIENIEISTFDSAEHFLKKMDLQPSLVILDFYLDGENDQNMNGHEAIQHLRQLKKQPNIIFISSIINEALLQEYSNYRNIDFILKSELGTARVKRKIEDKISQNHLVQIN